VCGIAGFCLKPDHIGDLDTNAVARELLLGIEERGRDATGAAWFGRNNGATVQKWPVNATSFAHKLTMGNRTSTAILHTRMATMGSPKQNENNHPIIAPGAVAGKRVIGTHNGWVNNIGTLVDSFQLPRSATVDSEVIFSLLTKYGEDYNLIGRELSGNYACAWIRENGPGELFLMRGYSSPLVLLESDYGIFYASTIKALQTIEPLVGKPKVGYLVVEEGRALHVVNGEVEDTNEFTVNEENWFSQYDVDTGWRYGRGYTDWPVRSFHQYQDGNTTTTYVPQSHGTKYYINERKGRVSFLGATAREVADYLELEVKDDTEPSQYGYYVYISSQCIDFVPYNRNKKSDPGMVLLEDLLYLSAADEHGTQPKLIQDVANDLMDKCWDETEETEATTTVVQQDEGTLPDGQKFKTFAGEVMLLNPESGEFEPSGLSYQEFLDNDGREKPVKKTTELIVAGGGPSWTPNNTEGDTTLGVGSPRSPETT